jgi:hypothetical protein
VGVTELSVLVTASPETRRCLDIIKANVNKEIPSAEYYEKMHYASFKNPSTNRRFVQLNPLGKQIRLFTKLPVPFDVRLELTPSSSSWAETYPSIFKIRSEADIEKATYLIIKSYVSDLEKAR